MKIIKYEIADEINIGTEEKPDIIHDTHEVIMPWSDANEEIAKKEAYNREYKIVDDGQPKPEPSESEQLRYDVDELQEALNMILMGVTE